MNRNSRSSSGFLGARLIAPNRCQFRVWAPKRDRVELHIVAPGERRVPLERDAAGYHQATVDAGPGTRYFFTLDGTDRPDPASRFQPEGVHRASEVVSESFDWTDAKWKGIALEDFVIYELHVGTFTPEGTFDAVIARLDDLKELGITAIELMPIGQFPGTRNWGYDGVYIGAAQNSYGGPLALKRLVDAAHARGLAVLLDVVYNHLGPDGNYLRQFSQQYFTDRHSTPWGDALNLDGPGSAPVRDFFIANACYWAHEYHIDGLRLDATHALIDTSEKHLLAELVDAVHASLPPDRHFLLIAENENNDPNL